MASQLGKAAFWGLTTPYGTLPQSATNGASNLGSLHYPGLPKFLPSTASIPPSEQEPH